ncbi:MAG: DsbA family oxidoreductase [Anaerolineales bacterium]|nr:DsbA family oxidoreductase [Anaerolineales bacterium]
MTVAVMRFSDYVCPWCAMGEAALAQLQVSRNVELEIRAYELRPAGTPPLPPAQEAAFRRHVRDGWPRVQRLALERFGLELNRPEDGSLTPTRLAHIATKYVLSQSAAQGEAFHRAVFRAHWQELRDISAVDVLADLARGVGLDEAAFRAALDDPNLNAAVKDDEAWANANGLSGVPAFILGERYLVSGAQPLSVLEQAVDRCQAEGLTI